MASATQCPRKDEHTPAPRDLTAWHEWSEQMAQTHGRARCPGCRLWLVWIPKKQKKGAPAR